MDFGRITIDQDLVLYLFGTPGQDRFDFMWEILGEGMLGYVLLLDAQRPESLDEAVGILAAFRRMAHVPFVVGLNRAEGMEPGTERGSARPCSWPTTSPSSRATRPTASRSSPCCSPCSTRSPRPSTTRNRLTPSAGRVHVPPPAPRAWPARPAGTTGRGAPWLDARPARRHRAGCDATGDPDRHCGARVTVDVAPSAAQPAGARGGCPAAAGPDAAARFMAAAAAAAAAQPQAQPVLASPATSVADVVVAQPPSPAQAATPVSPVAPEAPAAQVTQAPPASLAPIEAPPAQPRPTSAVAPMPPLPTLPEPMRAPSTSWDQDWAAVAATPAPADSPMTLHTAAVAAIDAVFGARTSTPPAWTAAPAGLQEQPHPAPLPPQVLTPVPRVDPPSIAEPVEPVSRQPELTALDRPLATFGTLAGTPLAAEAALASTPVVVRACGSSGCRAADGCCGACSARRASPCPSRSSSSPS